MGKKINYGSESVEITKITKEFLDENDYRNESLTKIVELMENSLVDFSILKLYEWGYNVDKLNYGELCTLSGITKIIYNFIDNEKQSKEYFMQYCHCMINLFGRITSDEEIKFKIKDLGSKDSVEHYYGKDFAFKEIDINKDIEIYRLPCKVLEIFKEYARMMDRNSINEFKKRLKIED